MPLRITAIREDSVLKPHGVQEGDYLAHINAWAVHTKSNAKVAYKTGNLDLVFRRNGQPYEVQLVAEDLGVSVEDESGEVFDLSMNALESARSPHHSSEPVVQNHEFAQRSRAPVSASILKIIAWIFFVLTVLGSIILISDLVLAETPDQFGTAPGQLHWRIIGLIVISLMSSAFFLALSYLLSHIQGQLLFIRSELKEMDKKLRNR
ncbi:hypothetical protein ACR0ST_03425 [Aliidiomarina sp. Khilg15.8]